MEGLQSNDGKTLTLPKDLNFSHAHSKEKILSDPLLGINTTASHKNICNSMVFLYQIEPKSFKEAKNDKSWIFTM